MDPVSALSLAANVVQFVDFTWKLLSATRSIYHSPSGSTAEHEDLYHLSSDLIAIDNDLTALAAPGAIPESLRLLSGRCKEIAAELLGILENLQTSNPHRKWKSFVQALRSVYKKGDIENLARRLERLQTETQMRISIILL